MRRSFVTYILCTWVICGLTGQDNVMLTGSWENERGSVLVIDSITQDHAIIGEYRSSTGTDGRTFPLHGWINNTGAEDGVTTISFSVRWEGYGSITSWTGYCDVDGEGPYIKTLWHLVRPGTEFAWERVIANSSVFRPFQTNK